MSAAPPAVELVPVEAAVPAPWIRLTARVAGLILALPFVDQTATLLVWLLTYGVPACLYRTVMMRYALPKVTLPPAGTALGERGRGWFVVEGVLLAIVVVLAVLGVDWPAYVLGLATGQAVADAWEASTIRRFEREKGWRLFRAEAPRAFRWQYFALPNA